MAGGAAAWGGAWAATERGVKPANAELLFWLQAAALALAGREGGAE